MIPNHFPTLRACRVESCGRAYYARGWCDMHYRRWRRHGSPNGAPPADPEAMFNAGIEPLVWSSCIVWTGGTTAGGYGQLRVNGRMVYAHRYAWERANGPIPEGVVIDHRCWVRSCVNVDHLRLATRAQNTQNLSGIRRGRKYDLPRGVARHGRGYRAMVGHNGVRHYLGIFDTIEQASAAASSKRLALFGEYAGGA